MKKPTKELWMVEEYVKDGKQKSYWTKVGVAWENRDGSFNLEIAAMPVNGRLQMRDMRVWEDDDKIIAARRPAKAAA